MTISRATFGVLWLSLFINHRFAVADSAPAPTLNRNAPHCITLQDPLDPKASFSWTSHRIVGGKTRKYKQKNLCAFTVYDPSCRRMPDDPFEPSVKFAWGPRVDQVDNEHLPERNLCVATSVPKSLMRSVTVLTEAQKLQYEIPPKQVAFANFAHHHRFWIASLDLAGVDEVYAQVEDFQIKGNPWDSIPIKFYAGHFELRYKMKPGFEVQLYEQDHSSTPEARLTRKVLRVRNLLSSVESVGPENNLVFSPVEGVNPVYGEVYRLLSMDERYETMVNELHHPVDQFRLALTTGQKKRLLGNAISLSHFYQMNFPYYTLLRSCATEAYKLLDFTVGEHYTRAQRNWIRTVGLTGVYPILGEQALRHRGLVVGPHVDPNLEVDQDYLQDYRANLADDPSFRPDEPASPLTLY